MEMKPNDTDKKVMPEPSNLGASLSLMSSGQGWGGQRRENNVHPTKEERDQWRERLSSPYTCFDAAHADFTIRLLDALEEVEAEKERLEQEVFFWREETKDVREIFNRQLGYKDVEIARLEREADVLSLWLANAYIDIDLLPDIDSGAMNPPLPEDVREAAREAARKDELQT